MAENFFKKLIWEKYHEEKGVGLLENFNTFKQKKKYAMVWN